MPPARELPCGQDCVGAGDEIGFGLSFASPGPMLPLEGLRAESWPWKGRREGCW